MAGRKGGTPVAQDSIVEAGLEVLRVGKLTDWTVDSVATKAGCAKGLVLYHFKSKDAFLLRVADRVRQEQAVGRLAALRGPRGAAALDRLWTCLAAEVKSGTFGLWVGLLGDSRTRKAAARTQQDSADLVAASAEALSVAEDSMALPLIPAALDGFSLELLQGGTPASVRERFDTFWLGVLSDAEA